MSVDNIYDIKYKDDGLGCFRCYYSDVCGIWGEIGVIRDKECYKIVDTYIDKSFKRKGLESELIRAAIKEMDKNGLKSVVEAGVIDEMNRGIYQEMGFIELDNGDMVRTGKGEVKSVYR